jgi:hypothetical protein
MTNQEIAATLTAAVVSKVIGDASLPDIPALVLALYGAILRGLEAGQQPYSAMFGAYEQAKR